MLKRYDRRAVVGAFIAASTVDARASTRPKNKRCVDQRFANSLVAAGPHASLGRHADTYGRLVGHWLGTYQDMEDQKTVDTGTIEVHFAWVLEGRAVQDTWMAPSGTAPLVALGKRQTLGTTLRVFDPNIGAWRCSWISPNAGARKELVGRRVGEDIVQYCVGQDRPEQWVFSEIRQDSFLWRGLVLADDGVAWNVGTEFHLTRVV